MKEVNILDFETINEVNGYLVRIFNEIMQIEEESLRNSAFMDLTIKEMHTIEAIGLVELPTSNEVAKKLSVTAGTLSVSIQNLVKKGYVERLNQPNDRRVVRLNLTKKGRLVYRLHHKFHTDMVKDTLTGLEREEAQVLIKGLRNLNQFLDNVKNRMNEG
ncbi:winged helix-turn-helix transcriptional regulator [Aerococcaceae bacterium zg-ZJ1578]|nr:winged helix-turn-helix transcriptional regulator [Aerococcaceae bacterium zg-1578]MBR7927967.1 winged helix-turn-helix transcriptional regulator [Aerococcaceae bacterium zg-ZUI334]MBS4461171.1 winged helix-turn-helix transcriptional regulator [Aerococcaceae bacterium zg-B36]